MSYCCKNSLTKACDWRVSIYNTECSKCTGESVRDDNPECSVGMSAHAPQSAEHTLPILAIRSYRDWSKDTNPYDIFHESSVDDLPHLLTGLSLISSIENERSQKTTTPLKIPPSASTCHDFPGKVADHAGDEEFSSTHEENLLSAHTAGLETSVGEGSTKPEDFVPTSPRNSNGEYNSLNEGVKREEDSQPTSPSVTSFGSYDMLDLDDSDNGVKTHTRGGTQKKRKMSGDSVEQSGSGSNEQSPNANGYDSPDQHPLGGGGGGRRRKGKEVGGSGLLSDKRFACPYFKRDPVRYRRCETWSCSEKHRVKSHVFRTHLKPEECPLRCGFRAGHPHQIIEHLVTGCKPNAIPAPFDIDTDMNLVRLERGFSWQQIYACLFDCDVKEAPDPYVTTCPSPGLDPITSPNDEMPGPIDLQDFGKFAWERLAPILQKTMEQALPSILAEYQVSGRVGSLSSSTSSQSLNLPGEGMAGLNIFDVSPFSSEFGMDHDPSRAPQWPGGSPNNIDSRDAPQPQVDGGHELSHRTLVMSGANDDEYFDFDKYIQSPNPGLGGE